MSIICDICIQYTESYSMCRLTPTDRVGECAGVSRP